MILLLKVFIIIIPFLITRENKHTYLKVLTLCQDSKITKNYLKIRQIVFLKFEITFKVI